MKKRVEIHLPAGGGEVMGKQSYSPATSGRGGLNN